MFFNISKYSIQWLCVIFLLLIQIDVCMPFMDTVSYQVEMCENTNPDESGEQETNDEVFYQVLYKLLLHLFQYNHFLYEFELILNLYILQMKYLQLILILFQI